MARSSEMAVGFVATVGLVFSAPAWADADPHVPDGNVGWCPAGDVREHISGGGRYCLASPFPDGTFYAQRWGHSPSPFGPGFWSGEQFPGPVPAVVARWMSTTDVVANMLLTCQDCGASAMMLAIVRTNASVDVRSERG